MKTYELRDLIAYRKKISDLLESDSDELILNDSISHAAIVQSAILDTACQKKLPVYMYCGEFSIYQDKTRRKVEDDVPELKEGKGDGEFHPYDCLLTSLNKFFKNDGEMTVILDRPLVGLSQQNLWQYIQKPIQEGQLRFFLLSPFGLDHFTTAGRMYRRENSDEHKTAYCCFNSDKAQVLNSAFRYLLMSSTPTCVQ